ncbi:hypothetical protein BDR26DRAFT_850350, partial [Obelidium mucronatum]
MLGNNRRRAVSVNPASPAPSTAKKGATPKPKPKPRFDTAVHNLTADMQLTPSQKRLRDLARDKYTSAHREMRANQRGAKESESAGGSPSPASTVAAAPDHDSRSEDVVVDFDCELEQYLNSLNPETRSKANTIRARIPKLQQQQPSKLPPQANHTNKKNTLNSKEHGPVLATVPNQVQNQLIDLLEALETLTVTINPNPVASEPPPSDHLIHDPENEFFVLSHTLSAATNAVTNATRLVKNNFLRTESMASSMLKMAEKMQALEKRLGELEVGTETHERNVETLQMKVLSIETESNKTTEGLSSQMDSIREEFAAVRFGNRVFLS